MKYCPRCGTLLRPQKTDNGIILVCPHCQFREENLSNDSYRIKNKVYHHPSQKFYVAEDEILLPRTKIICPKCGNNEAYYWMRQTRSGDEPATRFFKCTKCGYTWREYD
ncbi:MAG: transcription factor S [Thermofilum sp. ex4484_82]|nr:transcription factor S [Thermoproteales archaeon]OYT25841.1 MAG: transcription factor S [Thermofilum sp. ex4484_82]OYT36419.1 MAG: transcription factor S [Archaeoglobales archaeon ex4484_92]RLE75862.1 MAG: transcription factor S [Thermoprotei archaeon]RLE78162.1 MAG: transcription factor S [Thermoprotei archaeon]